MDLPVDPIQHECLSYAIYHEARSESFKGQLMVGFVIKNRVNDNRWEGDYCSVIQEPSQFSFFDSIGFAPMSEDYPSERAELIAWSVIVSHSPFPECMLYYHEESVRPNWDYTKIDVYDQEDAHVFYTDANC